MFGIDTTSGSVLYSRAFLVQPFTILVYDAENPGSFNSNLYSFIDMFFVTGILINYGLFSSKMR